MAYGRNQPKSNELRMADLGRAPVTHDLATLRLLSIAARGTMAAAAWPPSILDTPPSGKGLDAVMLRAQSGLKGTLNSVWAEKARIAAKEAVKEQWARARKNLFGRFKHLSTTGDKPLECGAARLINLPEEWSTTLTPRDVESMQGLADSMDFAGTIDLFRKVEAGKPPSCLSRVQADALLAMLDTAKVRYGCPAWKTDDAVVQLHLDFRCLPGGREAQDALLAAMTAAAVAGVEETVPVLVAGTVARSAPLAFKAVIRPGVLAVLLKSASKGADTRFTSLVLEISPTETVLKGVLSQTPKPFPLAEAKCLLGSDFGYVNTASAALVRVDRPLDAAWLEEVRDWTKKQSKLYLETHSHGGFAMQEHVFKGRNFLARIAAHAKRVDTLRSEIDLCYNRLARLKYEINRALGRPADTGVDLDAVLPNARATDLTPRFARLLGVVQHLKLLRRQVYRTVAGLKKSWFGHVTGKLAALCVEHRAAYVREDLSVLAKERASPDYKGRTFNKMLNNGAKGQFLRRMSDKLKWMGVPEVVVPSYYTSSTDVRNSVVDKKQRRGETFTAKADGRRMHADLHAALTLALWPLLRPNVTAQMAA